MYKVGIYDDNQEDCRKVEEYIKKHLSSQVTLLFFTSAQDLYSYLEQGNEIHILLMEIELEEEFGLETANKIAIQYPTIQIIFLTSSMEYCTEVYEIRHIYYIYKPKMNPYLLKAFRKAIQIIEQLNGEYLCISYRKALYQIEIKNILYLERNLRITDIFTTNKTYHSSERLSNLLERMPSNFAICNRSYAVNYNYITQMNRNYIMMQNGNSISLGNTYREAFREKCKEYMAVMNSDVFEEEEDE